ncbi:AMP-binding protein [Xanthomonas citri pv. durantae]|uniref:AMP-binding protein n=1 Tax=Xanthomonas citri pv. durantae TaxID=487862 RepID=A0A9X9N9H7_XANCI|nr:AMP-binding protein [Xanthomonas citri]QRD56563.1 AMP-binding protein [Xanthomonas citri pv. citri]UVG57005.1 AMP-binding protein [Xanthomonas citri pv. durantae]CEH49292.1 hypothetical protein XAC3615_13910004 [Xanthomonas citri pv. citri]CEH94260.1 hypothetical protein XAC3607_4280019 [Xanthomonas citri pv. citri]
MDWNRAETFGDLVDLAVAAFGDKVALRDEHRALTYRQFAGEIERIAAALVSYGLRPGARVAILSQNRVEVPVLLGLCRYGFVPVPLNWLRPRIWGRCCRTASPQPSSWRNVTRESQRNCPMPASA